MTRPAASTTALPLAGTAAQLAGRYARALVQVAVDQKTESNLAAELARVAAAIAQNADFHQFLVAPRLPVAVREKALLAIAAHLKLSSLLSNFLALLARQRRTNLLAAILVAAEQQLAQCAGEQAVLVTSASALTPAATNALQEWLAKAGHRHVKITNQVEPALLGGLTVQVGATRYDASIQGQLQRLARQMSEAA